MAINLTGVLPEARIADPEIFNRAVQIIQDLQHESTCHKQAVYHLAGSCNKIDVKPSEGNPHTEQVAESHESLFAARLAVCEISQAHVAIPKDCDIMLPKHSTDTVHGWKAFWTSQSTAKSDWTYPSVSEVEIGRCVTALHQVVQFWTSYSNAKQGAVSLCEASRSDNRRGKCRLPMISQVIERKCFTKHAIEIILDIYGKLTESLRGMPSAIQKVLDQLHDQSQAYVQFYDAMRKLKADHDKDVQASADKVMGFFAKLSQKVLNLHESADIANEVSRSLLLGQDPVIDKTCRRPSTSGLF